MSKPHLHKLPGKSFKLAQEIKSKKRQIQKFFQSHRLFQGVGAAKAERQKNASPLRKVC
jgi:hypothetical protein